MTDRAPDIVSPGIDVPLGAQSDPIAIPRAGAYSNLVAVSFLAGSMFMFTDLALEGYRPSELGTAKLLIGGATLLLPVCLGRRFVPMNRTNWIWVVLLGFVGYATPQLSLAWAQQEVDSSVAALFLAAMPLFTLLLVRVTLKEAYDWRKWTGFFIGFSGLIIMINPAEILTSGGHGLLPYLALSLTCLCFAISGIMVQRMPRLPALQTAALSLFVGGMVLAPFGLAGFLEATSDLMTAPDAGWENLKPVFGIVMLGTALSGLGQAMRTGLIQKYGTAFFSIVGYLVPIWAAFLGLVFLGEDITLRKVMAFVVICIGLLAAQGAGGQSKARRKDIATQGDMGKDIEK